MSFAAHRARKRFGQHWLRDEAVLRQIVAAAELTSEDRVLEVGPGRGALTERLLPSPAARVEAVELDRDLVGGLRERFAGEARFHLIEGDALAVELPPAEKVVANIPYNITGPLLEKLVGRLDRPVDPPYRRLVLLVQQEVGERIRAEPGSSPYSALSVRLQLLARCRLVCAVPPRCFQPPPKVHSEVIALDPLPGGRAAESRPGPGSGGAAAALLRRPPQDAAQTPSRACCPRWSCPRWSEPLGIDLQKRPQELAPPQWVALAGALEKRRGTAAGSAAP